MRVSRLRLILAYLLTVPVLAAGYFANGGVEDDARAQDVSEMVAVLLLVGLIVAIRRFGQGLSAGWYLRLCLAIVAFTGALLLYSGLVSHLGTPSVMLFGGLLAACSVGLLDRR